jgi:rod shape-determining protein MreC
LFIALGFSLALIITDSHSPYLHYLRATLTIIAYPVQWVAEVPGQGAVWAASWFNDRQQLRQENARQHQEILLLKQKLLTLDALVEENNRLQKLLNSSVKVPDKVLAAEIIGIVPNSFSRQLVINKGSQDKVQVGQALLDANGLMGQVISVGPLTSHVLLLTDASQAVPVQVNRTGLRAIVIGDGSTNQLSLVNVANTADVRVGDLLVTSGLGQRYPAGYPVGVISSVIHDPGQPFAVIKVKPSAHLARSRDVLLVLSSQQSPSTTQQGPHHAS